MGKVVGVRFQRGCKVYDFDSGAFVLQPGQHVIVQTEQGLALGQVVRGPLPQLKLVPTGGVTPENAAEFSTQHPLPTAA